jgi:hypothetical protein
MNESALATVATVPEVPKVPEVPEPIKITQFEALLSDIKIAKDEAAEMPVFDFTSKEGNQAARSYVYNTRKLNGRIDQAKAEAKRFVLDYGRAVDARAKELKDQVAALIQPVQDGIEEAARVEAERIATLQRRLAEADGLGCVRYGATVAEIEGQLDELNGLSILGLQDYETPVLAAMTRSRKQLETALEQAKAAEAQAAELARLQREQEAREAAEKAAKETAEAEAKEVEDAKALVEQAADALSESAAEAEARLVDSAVLWGAGLVVDADGNANEIQPQPSAPAAVAPAEAPRARHASAKAFRPPGQAEAAEQSRRRRLLLDQLLAAMGSMRREAVATAIADGRLHAAVSVDWGKVQ